MKKINHLQIRAIRSQIKLATSLSAPAPKGDLQPAFVAHPGFCIMFSSESASDGRLAAVPDNTCKFLLIESSGDVVRDDATLQEAVEFIFGT